MYPHSLWLKASHCAQSWTSCDTCSDFPAITPCSLVVLMSACAQCAKACAIIRCCEKSSTSDKKTHVLEREFTTCRPQDRCPCGIVTPIAPGSPGQAWGGNRSVGRLTASPYSRRQAAISIEPSPWFEFGSSSSAQCSRCKKIMPSQL